MSNDIDRKRIEDKAGHAVAIIRALEQLALDGAAQQTHQLDGLKEELAGAYARLSLAERTIASAPEVLADVDMTVGLDDVRAILVDAANESAAVGGIIVADEDTNEIQVIDSVHALLDEVRRADVAEMVARAEIASARDRAARTEAERDAAIRAAADNASAEADGQAAATVMLEKAIGSLVGALFPIDRSSSKLAMVANPVAAIDIVTASVKELAFQIADGGEGETAKALAMARADADRIEDEIHAIEAACEAAGMAATVERADIPAWLAANLKPRAKASKVKAGPSEEDIDGSTSWVVMRNDANGRRFHGAAVWGSLDAADRHASYVSAHDAKPRGAKVVGIVEAQRLLENDARVAASASLPLDHERISDDGGAEGVPNV